jgi:hypothetical protein
MHGAVATSLAFAAAKSIVACVPSKYEPLQDVSVSSVGVGVADEATAGAANSTAAIRALRTGLEMNMSRLSPCQHGVRRQAAAADCAKLYVWRGFLRESGRKAAPVNDFSRYVLCIKPATMRPS